MKKQRRQPHMLLWIAPERIRSIQVTLLRNCYLFPEYFVPGHNFYQVIPCRGIAQVQVAYGRRCCLRSHYFAYDICYCNDGASSYPGYLKCKAAGRRIRVYSHCTVSSVHIVSKFQHTAAVGGQYYYFKGYGLLSHYGAVVVGESSVKHIIARCNARSGPVEGACRVVSAVV